MARYGAKYIKWAPFKTADTSAAAPVYDQEKVLELSELTTANWTPTIASGQQYGNNMKVEDISQVTGGTLALEITDLSEEARIALYGNKPDNAGSATKSVQGAQDEPPYGGLVYIKCGVRNGVYYWEGYFYPKCKAVPSADGVQTGNSSITLSGDSLSLSVLPRLNDQGVREISKRFTTEAEAVTWCNTQLAPVGG